MPANSPTAKRIWNIFTKPTPPQRKAYLENISKDPVAAQNAIVIFSHFNADHMQRVKEIVEKWRSMIASNGKSEEQLLNAVLDDYESLQGKENPDLLYFSLEVFLTHLKSSSSFSIPSILVREPELTSPSTNADGFVQEVALGSAAETKLDWFREDPLLNEHHAHWHVVYPSTGEEVYDRQGEMFFYMHQQMLARYDAQRIAEDVKRVIPFSDMRKPIQVGYTAGPDESISQQFGKDRKPGKSVESNAANWQVQARKLIVTDIDKGMYDPDPATIDPLVQETDAINALASTIEANQHPQARNRPYRSYHAAGHNFIGDINKGVMYSTLVAIRDSVFWEWHKEVDTHYVRFQERFKPYDFLKDAPPVLMRNGSNENGEPDSMDVILCFSKDIPGFNDDFDGAAVGELAFGGKHWDKDFANASASYKDANDKKKSIITTNTLTTTINYGTVQYELDGEQKQYDFSYLNHEPFCYFIRVQNKSHQQKQVTVRIFMAPQSQSSDRTAWIEMDKFLYELEPNSKTVIFRSDTEASVIRKPAVKDPTTYNVTFEESEEEDEVDCKCGWPYHLLVPKGQQTEEGIAYKLVVMMSDGEKDAVIQEGNCGSLSFCAAKEAMYPDKRPLGYPFNRKFKGNGDAIIKTVTTQPNFACRSIKIQHTL